MGTWDRPTPRHPFTLYQYRRHGCSLRSLDPICDLLGHVRRLRRSPLQDPTHAERRQAGEALGGSVGQRQGAGGLRAEQSVASREGRLVRREVHYSYCNPESELFLAKEGYMYETLYVEKLLLLAE